VADVLEPAWMVPYVELPLATPFTVQVTAVLVVPLTEATMDNVPPASMFADAGVGLVMETATVGVGVAAGAPPPLAPQPAIVISTPKAIPKTHASRRKPRLIDPDLIIRKYRFELFNACCIDPRSTVCQPTQSAVIFC